MGFSPWKIAFGIPAAIIAAGITEITFGGYINDSYKAAQPLLNSTGLPIPQTDPFNTGPGWIFFIVGVLILVVVLYFYTRD